MFEACVAGGGNRGDRRGEEMGEEADAGVYVDAALKLLRRWLARLLRGGWDGEPEVEVEAEMSRPATELRIWVTLARSGT